VAEVKMIKTNGELRGGKLLAGAAALLALLATPMWLPELSTKLTTASVAAPKKAAIHDPAWGEGPYTFKGSTKGCKDWKYVGKPDNCDLFDYPTVVFVVGRDTGKNMKCVYRRKETGCRWVDADLLIPYEGPYEPPY
jgi:hypothetical protein